MFDLLYIPFGKRMLGIWEQIPIESKDEAIKIIEKHLGFKHIGISICTYHDDNIHLLFLPFDFDSKDICKAWNDSKKLFNYFIELGISCIFQFSGSKGFHVIAEVAPKIYSSRQMGEVQKFFRDMLGLETLDEQIFGDMKRLIRITWTFNPNGSWCRPIAYNEGNKLDLDDIYDEPYIESTKHMAKKNKIQHYPCVEYLIGNKSYWKKHHERHSFEPSEPIRLTWASIRLRSKDSIEEILEEAEAYEWDDWDEDKTRKKLEYLDSKEWNPYSCHSLKEMGYCIKEINCPYRMIDDEDLESIGIVNGRDV